MSDDTLDSLYMMLIVVAVASVFTPIAVFGFAAVGWIAWLNRPGSDDA